MKNQQQWNAAATRRSRRIPVTAIGFAAVLSALTVTAGAQTWVSLGGKTTGNISSVSWGGGRIDLFVREADNAIYHKFYNNYDGVWRPTITDWESLGGSMAGNVSAVSIVPGRLDLFARDSTNAIVHKSYDYPSDTWTPSKSGWDPVPDLNSVSADAVAVTPGSGRIDVFVRGPNFGLYDKVLQYDQALKHGAWVPGLTSLGGATYGNIAAVSCAPGQLDVFVRGTDSMLYQNSSSTGGEWTGWLPLGMSIAGDPAAVSWGGGRLDIFVRNISNVIQHRFFDGSWYVWEPLGGATYGELMPVSWGSPRIDLFVRGTNNIVYHNGTSTGYGDWSGWEPFNMTTYGDVSAVSFGLYGRVDIFAPDTSNAIQHAYYQAGWWH
jgi:hypothetical protein